MFFLPVGTEVMVFVASTAPFKPLWFSREGGKARIHTFFFRAQRFAFFQTLFLA
jgi:hypothetical protein